MNSVYIFHAMRTPLTPARRGGAYYELRPIDLLKQCLQQFSEDCGSGFFPKDFILGCTAPTGDLGQNIARAGLLHAGKSGTSGLQINRFDLSGLDAVGLAAAKISSGLQDSIIAGGLELRSRLASREDSGPWTDDPDLAVLPANFPPVFSADLQAALEGRELSELNALAALSEERYQGNEPGAFSFLQSIYDENGLLLLDDDELTDSGDPDVAEPVLSESDYRNYLPLAQKQLFRLESFARLHTRFTVAGEADGLSLLLLGSEKAITTPPLARVVSYALLESENSFPFSGMEAAAKKVLNQAGLQPEAIDLWSCDEAFAATALNFQKHLAIPSGKINVSGGNLAFGRPAGANGALLLVRLLEDLKNRQLKYGLLAISDRTGSSAAMIIQNL